MAVIRAGWFALTLATAAIPTSARDAEHWLTGWAAAQQRPDARNQLPADMGQVSTLRQVVRVAVAGTGVRLRLSNVFGVAPLTVAGVHVALSAGPGSAALQPGSDRAVLFAGAESVTVPAGADYWSDPVPLRVAARSSLAVSMKLVVPAENQTIHTASHATSFLAAGDDLSAPDMPKATRIEHWGFLSGIDVAASRPGNGIVALGDSITDGSWSTTDGNDRWPDVLNDRLQARSAASATGRGTSVLNLGIGGNRLLLDGNGPNALSRFDRDVLAQSGVRFVILLEGINDIGTLTREGSVSAEQHRLFVARIIGAYRQIIFRAHLHGLKVFGGTLLPFGGAKSYQPDAASDGDRAEVNHWIRHSGAFDDVIDFDAMVRDPAHPDRLLPAYDSGDHLHPSPAGYRRMGSGIPLALFQEPDGGSGR